MKGKQLNESSDNIYFNNDEIWKEKKRKGFENFNFKIFKKRNG